MFLFLRPRNGKIARSSNGRTSDFGSDCVGSNPARATSLNKSAPYGADFLFDAIRTSLLDAECDK